MSKRPLLMLATAALALFVAVEAKAGCGGQLQVQAFVQPYAAQQVFVQPFVLQQHARQQVVLQNVQKVRVQKVRAPQRQVVRQRIITRSN